MQEPADQNSINVVTDGPYVEIIGAQQILKGCVNNFLDQAGLGEWSHDPMAESGDLLAEFGGRICYTSFGEKQGRKNTQEYLDNLVSMNHGSVFEHTVYTLAVCKISRSLSHELIRHRVGVSPSELSQRYVDLENVRFILPKSIKIASPIYPQWYAACEDAYSHYMSIATCLDIEMRALYPEMGTTDRRKHTRQTARAVLPNCTETMMVLTMNARALRHIITLRGSAGAEIEIRAFANKLYDLFDGSYFLKGLTRRDHIDGVPVIEEVA